MLTALKGSLELASSNYSGAACWQTGKSSTAASGDAGQIISYLPDWLGRAFIVMMPWFSEALSVFGNPVALVRAVPDVPMYATVACVAP